MAGPLKDVKVLEFGAIGPTSFAGGYLADFGADVVRVDRPGLERSMTPLPEFDFYNRNKRSIALDLKAEEGRETARQLAAQADVVIEGSPRRDGTARTGAGHSAFHQSPAGLRADDGLGPDWPAGTKRGT